MDPEQFFKNLPDVLSVVIDAGLPWLHHYGLIAVAVGLMTETLFFTGVWIPGYGILVAAGFLIGAGEASAWAVILLAWVGGVIGDTLSYFLGRWVGGRLLRRHEAVATRIRTALETEGPFLLLTYHFTPVLRAFVPCVAGSSRYNLRRWFCFDPVGLLVWEVTALAIGYLAHGALYSGSNVIALLLNAMATLLVLVISWRFYQSYRAFDSPTETETSLPIATNQVRGKAQRHHGSCECDHSTDRIEPQGDTKP